MPTDEYVANIIIGVKNKEEIAKLTKDIADEEKEIAKLNAQLAQGSISQAQWSSQTRSAASNIAIMRSEVSELEKNLKKIGEAESGATGIRTITSAMHQMADANENLMFTIPRLAVMLGATGELGIGLAVIAAAIEVLINRWESLQDVFASNEGLADARSALDKLADWFDDHPALVKVPTFGPGMAAGIRQWQAGEANRAERKRGDQIEEEKQKAGIAAVKGAQSEAQKGYAKQFSEALGAAGGGNVVDEMVKQRVAGRQLTPTQLEEIRTEVEKLIGEGEKGHIAIKPLQERPEGLDPNLEAVFGKQLAMKHDELEQRKVDIQTMQNEHRGRKNVQDFDKKQEKEFLEIWKERGEIAKKAGEEIKKENIGKLEDQKYELEKKERQIREDMAEKKRTEQPAQILDTRAWVNMTQTNALNNVPTAQLNELKAIKKKIEVLNDTMRAARKAPAAVFGL